MEKHSRIKISIDNGWVEGSGVFYDSDYFITPWISGDLKIAVTPKCAKIINNDNGKTIGEFKFKAKP